MDAQEQWLILGISGVTCGGKTSLSQEISKLLPNIKIISQDEYFLPQASEKHTYIPELKHINWEILSSMDMEKMVQDIQAIIRDNRILNINVSQIMEEFNNNGIQHDNKKILKNDLHLIKNKLSKFSVNILLIEGFSIFNYSPIDELCHLKFFLTLNRQTCLERRNKRIYDPPDVPGYFEKYVWPEYIRHLNEVQEKRKNIVFLSEEIANKCVFIFNYLVLFFSKIT